MYCQGADADHRNSRSSKDEVKQLHHFFFFCPPRVKRGEKSLNVAGLQFVNDTKATFAQTSFPENVEIFSRLGL